MPTRIGKYCEGIIEAGWLAAVILVPIFFNVYSSRIFEPDKITLLRSLALLMLGAWLIKIIDEGRIRLNSLPTGQSSWKVLLKTPLVLPALVITVVYLVATIFSVSPRTSLWGSYQRLQGFYTTLSYLIIFSMLLANLRRRKQVDRLVTTIVLASLPVALYGILQHYQLDPIPWGGDTTVRIAANMGNAIFVAAYMVMAFPLTAGRIVESFTAIMRENSRLYAHVARATVYVFTAFVQVIALYMSGSRGPVLGFLASAFIMFLLLTILWRKRWMTITVSILAVFGAVSLIVLNIPGGPLESIRKNPIVGRFGQILDSESTNALVRKYIWQGAAELVSPHEPLEYPDGSNDRFNIVRPLIGYGPESMYVAYNPFYPPLLGHVERRNASPDRSHNETWDSLVTTGWLGFLAYLFIFMSVFYFGLLWLGVIPRSKDKVIFFSLVAGGGIAGALLMIAWGGVAFFGVGLPFGMAIGLVFYISLAAVTGVYQPPKTHRETSRFILLVALLSAILAHFLEINFGIAIAVTRTYFWVFSALLLLIGVILPARGEFGSAEANTSDKRQPVKVTSNSARSKRSRRKLSTKLSSPGLTGHVIRHAVAWGFVSGIMLSVIGFCFVTNANRLTDVFSIFWSSLTRLQSQGIFSAGILMLVLVTWLFLAIVAAGEMEQIQSPGDYLKYLAWVLGVSGITAFLFWLLQASNLAYLASIRPSNEWELMDQVKRVGSLLTEFYIYLFVIVVLAAFFLSEDWPIRLSGSNNFVYITAPIISLVVFWLISWTNLRVIHADMTFKLAEPFTQGDQWPIASKLYAHAIDQAPNEDYYYLFLGRSYLEQAKTIEEPTAQATLVHNAERDLKTAQSINPLNTDHTANLARLYTWWATKSTTPEDQMSRGQIASDYYARALTLSKNNSTLWGEWAMLLLDVLHQPDEALKSLRHALSLDEEYGFTQALLGEYYVKVGRMNNDQAMLETAVTYYLKAADVSRSNEKASKVNYLVAAGNIYLEMAGKNTDNLDPSLLLQSVQAFEQALAVGPATGDVYRIEEQVARIYAELGEKEQANQHALLALAKAPEAEVERLKSFVAQIQSLP
jgi:tetratricopeptide (TPR) repeat protein